MNAMQQVRNEKIFELADLRDKTRIFRNREHAGQVVAAMLTSFQKSEALIMAIPSGGVPVAVALAKRLDLALEVAPVSKITLPWNTEAGYGAVAWEGTTRLNADLLPVLRLTESQIEEGKRQTLEKCVRRFKKFRGDLPFPDLGARPVILVDDGLASGFTLLVAVEALRKAGASNVMVAVPTGSWKSVLKVSRVVESLYCANIREGWSFSVAEAYQRWMDVDEEEAVAAYRAFQQAEKVKESK
jgi:predicted phosphoribosyltransferase